jgi:hypothetical protein
MTLEQYEIGFKYQFSSNMGKGTFYYMIFAPNRKEAIKIMHQIYGKKEIRIVSIQLAEEAYPSKKVQSKQGDFEMDIKEAKEILGDRATWELKNMKRALMMLPILNTDEDNQRLEAVKVMLKYRKSKEKL